MDTSLALQLLATSTILWIASGMAHDCEWWSRENHKLGAFLKEWAALLFVVSAINMVWSC